MSSGSYFTIYRKNKTHKASDEALAALKNEFFLANKKEIFGKKDNEEEMKKDIPVLMHSTYKADHMESSNEDKKSDIYYDVDGIEHKMLLEFHFGSVFTALKTHFNLSPYSFSRISVLVSKTEAEKILQAIEYILGEDYNKKFEQVLNNEYVTILGDGYSPFDNRFKAHKDPIYIDKEGRNYVVNFGDYSYAAETAESDNDVKFNLRRVRACLLAFINADENTWDGEELVLEYSAY